MQNGRNSKTAETNGPVKERTCIECDYCQPGAEPYGGCHYVCTHQGKILGSDVTRLKACADFKTPQSRPAR